MVNSFDENNSIEIVPTDGNSYCSVEGTFQNQGSLQIYNSKSAGSASGGYDTCTGSLKTVTAETINDLPYGYNIGDKYLDCMVTNLKNSRVLVNLTSLRDIYTAGNGISILNNVISNTRQTNWGDITGSLSEQTDLQNALDTIVTNADVTNYVPKTQIATKSLEGIVNLDTINQSKGMETGSVSSDINVFEDIKSYAHSTFDSAKLTIVGTANISDKGFALFASDSYINLSSVLNSYVLGQTINFKTRMKYETRKDVLQTIFCMVDNVTSRDPIQFGVSTDNKKLFIRKPTSTTAVSSYIGFGNLTPNQEYDLELDYDATTLRIYIDGVLEYSSEVPSEYYVSSSCTTLIGNNSYRGLQQQLDHNPIDLKYTCLRVNGVPVFCGNKTGVDSYTINNASVQIPYIESKTGSKIVDSVYRSRVEDVYEQFGCAPYYTIDEDNLDFTLPMGEVYGMIGKNTGDIKTNTANIATNTSNITSLSSSKVSKSGDTMTGKLTIQKEQPEINLNDTRFKFSQYNSLAQSYNNYLMFKDQDSLGYCWMRAHTSSSENFLSFAVRKLGDTTTGNSGLSDKLELKADTTNAWVTCPNSDKVHSVVTTEGINKATNGYVKLGNGIIMQWGRFTSTDGVETTITLPTAFSSSNYKVVLIQYGTALVDNSWMNTVTITAQSTTGFSYRQDADENPQFNWIAIGY